MATTTNKVFNERLTLTNSLSLMEISWLLTCLPCVSWCSRTMVGWEQPCRNWMSYTNCSSILMDKGGGEEKGCWYLTFFLVLFRTRST